MRVWLHQLGYELAVPPVRMRGRKRLALDDDGPIERMLNHGIDPEEADDLRRLLVHLDGLEMAQLGHHDVVARLTDYIRYGRLWVLELEQLSAKIEEEPESYREVEVKQKDWIEIQLIDETGAPVPNVSYEITLPDGRRHRGVTNAKGVVRFDGIEPGVCDFTFDQLDEGAWTPSP